MPELVALGVLAGLVAVFVPLLRWLALIFGIFTVVLVTAEADLLALRNLWAWFVPLGATGMLLRWLAGLWLTG